jgi:hypothetical protein
VETWVAGDAGGANDTNFVGVTGGNATNSCECPPVLVCPRSRGLTCVFGCGSLAELDYSLFHPHRFGSGSGGGYDWG